MTIPTIDNVVKAYIQLRNKKAAIEKEAEEKTAMLKAQMMKLEGYIMEQASAQGVTSFKTKHGTAFVATTDFASVADWDATLKFIKEHDTYDMLERRVSKAAIRAYIDMHGSVPAGVNFGTKLGVNVRKPTTKAED